MEDKVGEAPLPNLFWTGDLRGHGMLTIESLRLEKATM